MPLGVPLPPPPLLPEPVGVPLTLSVCVLLLLWEPELQLLAEGLALALRTPLPLRALEGLTDTVRQPLGLRERLELALAQLETLGLPEGVAQPVGVRDTEPEALPVRAGEVVRLAPCQGAVGVRLPLLLAQALGLGLMLSVPLPVLLVERVGEVEGQALGVLLLLPVAPAREAETLAEGLAVPAAPSAPPSPGVPLPVMVAVLVCVREMPVPLGDRLWQLEAEAGRVTLTVGERLREGEWLTVSPPLLLRSAVAVTLPVLLLERVGVRVEDTEGLRLMLPLPEVL